MFTINRDFFQDFIQPLQTRIEQVFTSNAYSLPRANRAINFSNISDETIQQTNFIFSIKPNSQFNHSQIDFLQHTLNNSQNIITYLNSIQSTFLTGFPTITTPDGNLITYTDNGPLTFNNASGFFERLDNNTLVRLLSIDTVTRSFIPPPPRFTSSQSPTRNPPSIPPPHFITTRPPRYTPSRPRPRPVPPRTRRVPRSRRSRISTTGIPPPRRTGTTVTGTGIPPPRRPRPRTRTRRGPSDPPRRSR